jgi:carbonic anhydrase
MSKLRSGLLLVAAIALLGCRSETARQSSHLEPAAPAAEAAPLERLRAGNGRYVAGKLQHPRQDPKRRAQLTTGQQPFAAILGCSDSRTSPEVLFDQGLGDLFVVRVAGNVLNDEGLGSIEYAVEHLGTRLIVVLGHQHCGAVKAAQETVAAKAEAPGHIESLVAAIKPAVEATSGEDLEAAVRMNVRLVARALRSSPPLIKAKAEAGEIAVVGAYYDMDTGEVAFFEDKRAK